MCKRLVIKLVVYGFIGMGEFVYMCLKKLTRSTDDIAFITQTWLDAVNIPKHDLHMLVRTAEQIMTDVLPDGKGDLTFFITRIVRNYINGERL